MTDRTTVTMVTFKHPFTLASFDGPQAAGTYRLEVDEEKILGIPFPAFRRTAAMLHIPGTAASGCYQVYPVDVDELTRALAVDAQRA